MILEEGNYHSEKVKPPLDSILQEILAVVVVPAVSIRATDPKELFEFHESGRATRTLGHGEPMNHLIAGSVAGSSHPIGLPDETDGEAAFSVYETNNPASLHQPFLLIARTAQIVTAHT